MIRIEDKENGFSCRSDMPMIVKMDVMTSEGKAKSRLFVVEGFRFLPKRSDENVVRMSVLDSVKAKEKKEGRYGSASEAGYADPGYQEDGMPRYPLKRNGKWNVKRIKAAWNYINKKKNAGKYSRSELSKIRSRIIHAWKRMIDKDGPPSAEKAVVKSLSFASRLVWAFEDLRGMAFDRRVEAWSESDPEDEKFAEELDVLAEQVAGMIAKIAVHEGKEANRRMPERKTMVNPFPASPSAGPMTSF